MVTEIRRCIFACSQQKMIQGSIGHQSMAAKWTFEWKTDESGSTAYRSRTAQASKAMARKYDLYAAPFSLSAQAQVVFRDSGNSLSHVQTCDTSCMPGLNLTKSDWRWPRSHSCKPGLSGGCAWYCTYCAYA